MEVNEILHKMGRAQRQIRRLTHQMLVESPDISGDAPRGYGVILHMLVRHGDMSQKELAERMDIRPQSMTEAMLTLEEQGLIERYEIPEDRRARMVHITDTGREKDKVINEIKEKTAQNYLSCLTEDEKQTLGAIMLKLTDQWKDL